MPDAPMPDAASTEDNTLTDFLWRNTAQHKRMLAAIMTQLENTLLLTESATRTLEAWSQTHNLAPIPKIRALNTATTQQPCPPYLREKLCLTAKQAQTLLRYRHVRLMCGQHVLSCAENWYCPDRLTPAMNACLETTETPFGHAVSALNFTRTLVKKERLWAPSLHMKEDTPATEGHNTALTIPDALFKHQAILLRADGTPFSAVTETYTANLLRFTPPESIPG